jgi:biotin carboxyl carrier protein
MQNGEHKLTVNDTFDFNLTSSDLDHLDVVTLNNDHFHLLQNGKSYHSELISLDSESKTVQLKINGNHYQVKIADHYDLLVHKMGLSANIIHKISEIKAPMPGLVLSLAVEPGQEVVHGDPLLILEAMKMENVIKSPGEGKVKKIHVVKGKAVDKGELLIEMD